MRIAAVAGFSVAISCATAAERIFAPVESVRPVLEAMRDRLPPELNNASEAAWNSWSRGEDARIRARLEQGEIDSMIHLLLFGTSFTKRPRIQVESLSEATKSGLLRGRVDDLVARLRSPGNNERLAFLRNLVKRQGLDPDAADGETGVFLYRNLQRVLEERIKFGERVKEAAGEPVFRDRGVSLDATIFPNFVIEQTLRDLKNRGILSATARVAVIGPGLDFTDKESGYDYYPQQTLQPFAIYDSLVRLGLVKSTGLSVTVFDMSRRVLEHLNRARDRTKKGQGYRIQLPRDSSQNWQSAAVEYWRAFGDQAGKSVAPINPPASATGLETRAVEIRPAVVLACEPVDLNVVMERVNLPQNDRFDLVIATNVFVYYERFEQGLALQNVSTLLKSGGLLLSNDNLPEIPGVPMRRLGETAVRYTDRLGDTVLWYQRQ